MKVLIIGGDSFIASRFMIDYSLNYEIISFSRKEIKHKNNKVLKDFFSIKESDFRGFDVVINFAAIVHNPKGAKPEHYYRINHELAVRNAGLAKEAGVKHFIQLSTIAVYGEVQNIGITTAELPVNDYGRSKLMADNELLKMQDKHFYVTIVRPSMVYGGGAAPGNMLKLISYVKRGIPLPFKNVQNHRQFLNIHTLNGFLDYSINKHLRGIFILADKEGISTSALISLISRKIQVKDRQFKIPKIALSLLKKMRPTIYNKLFGNLFIDITNIEALALYKSDWDIENGVEEMIRN
ncbi:NAD-dependent epimerase/dehydratase family protein [Saccharicrinis sp. FJH2]|uniref:NAD-dependent epimerase/dehydratase family protein n=1 Tax=Saccharicrinis sp. FJH65 TaxID=3344659 RepID=UPI0035F421DF